MTPRIEFRNADPRIMQLLLAIEKYLHACGLESRLLHLVKTRASQINGCAYCVDMHTQDARAEGETEQRLYALTVWQDTPFFDERERAALEWTEAVTLVADTRVPDDVYERARQHFTEQQLINSDTRHYEHQRVRSAERRIPIGRRRLSARHVRGSLEQLRNLRRRR